MHLSDLQYLMHQLGPAMPEILTIIQHESDRWELAFDEEVTVEVGWQEKPPRTLLSCAIGEVPENLCEPVYARLLIANSLPSERLSLRFALDFPDERVLLLGELVEDHASLDTLRSDLASFVQCAVAMASFIAESAAAVQGVSFEARPEDDMLPRLV